MFGNFSFEKAVQFILSFGQKQEVARSQSGSPRLERQTPINGEYRIVNSHGVENLRSAVDAESVADQGRWAVSTRFINDGDRVFFRSNNGRWLVARVVPRSQRHTGRGYGYSLMRKGQIFFKSEIDVRPRPQLAV